MYCGVISLVVSGMSLVEYLVLSQCLLRGEVLDCQGWGASCSSDAPLTDRGVVRGYLLSGRDLYPP